MSYYILEDYINICRQNNVEPTAKGLYQFKKDYWKD